MVLYKKLMMASALALLLPTAAPAQEVFKLVSNQRLEDILKSMNIQFSKGTSKDNMTTYTYSHKNEFLRLSSFGGKDLMIDAVLSKQTWEVINKWNVHAKFSRAYLSRDQNTGEESSILEWNLDLGGGVTEETIRQFIRNFDNVLDHWLNLTIAAVSEEETNAGVTPERLEKILGDLKINYKKTQGKGTAFYDYVDRGNYKIRLTSFNGNDLMIDCVYPQAPLAKVNQWNVKRSFVRAVLYTGSASPYAALESNLDCTAPTSDSIIRYFITSFDGEAAAFDEHLKKQ